MSSVAKGMSGVIGREPELALLEEFLDGGTAWLALLLTGGPGIGKTALWDRGLGLAVDRGIRVLSARPSGAEAELSFAGLFDLLEGIDIGSVSGLPIPQRRALDAALLRAEPMAAAPERFAIAAGFLSVLRSLVAGALGSPGWAGQARAELDLLGTRGVAAAGALTAAEQRVVSLAASGLSNKQIARRLFVAVHTVEVHLAHAYAKLGVHSRAQLASRLASQPSAEDASRPSAQDASHAPPRGTD